MLKPCFIVTIIFTPKIAREKTERRKKEKRIEETVERQEKGEKISAEP